jgi:hypothetical protein
VSKLLRSGGRVKHDAHLIAFDLIELDGRDLRRELFGELPHEYWIVGSRARKKRQLREAPARRKKQKRKTTARKKQPKRQTTGRKKQQIRKAMARRKQQERGTKTQKQIVPAAGGQTVEASQQGNTIA